MGLRHGVAMGCRKWELLVIAFGGEGLCWRYRAPSLLKSEKHAQNGAQVAGDLSCSWNVWRLCHRALCAFILLLRAARRYSGGEGDSIFGQRGSPVARCEWLLFVSNNGDGARALFVAQRKGYVVGEPALATTKAWLRKPGEWENNHGDAGVNNLRLARIQFAAALREAPSVASLIEAARSLLPYQAADGSWPVEAETNLGRPQPMAWLWLLTWLGKL